jgi:hypothetical protein
MIRWLFPAAVGLFLAAAVPGFAQPPMVAPAAAGGIEASALVVVTGAGNRFRFAVELARTPEERAQGLQGRKTLAAESGMLFQFAPPQPVSMWMKNTYVSLDMIFIAGDGRIVHVARDTEPLSLRMIESPGPVAAVLELKAGTTARLGIRPGDRVEHQIFRSAR